MPLSEQFLFGAATAAYQIEGAVSEDGKTPSIWDTFSHTPGRICDRTDGDIACDHYHRWQEDVALLEELGVDSYRLSISWPRIFPEPGRYNPEGMAFYRKLCTQLRQRGIRPAITLYHWDLPQWAQDRGGWSNRESIDWFLEYARACFEQLDDVADLWITFNEPYCVAFLGHLTGRHAPGHRDLEEALRVAHHLLVAHGQAVRLYHTLGGKHPIGITLNFTPAFPASDTPADRLAAGLQDGHANRWFLDAIFHGYYPQDISAVYAARCATDFDFIHPGDFDIMAEPCDFLGVNYYTRSLQAYDPTALYLASPAYSDAEKTEMGWEIAPDCLEALIHRLREYTDLPIYITENGSAWQDELEEDAVHDQKRTDYLLAHLQAIDRLNREGMDVRGYYVWSLMDNFEWSFGFTKRFGLVYTDYPTQRRIKKDSFYAYRQWIAEKKAGR